MKKTPFLLAATVLAGPAFAQANDDCAGAIALTSGTAVAFDTALATVSGAAFPCAAGGGPDLWYSYTSTAADLVTIETCGSSYDTAIELFTGDCNNLVSVQCNDDACGLQSSVSVTAPAAGTTYYVRVGGYNGATGVGTILASEGDPCGFTPDMFEDNDDCPTAAPVGDGVYSGLNVTQFDGDFFAVTVPDGGTIDAQIDFIHANGDLDLYLWDPALACNSQIEGEGTLTGALSVGYTVNDVEIVTYTNTSGAPLDLIIEVDVWDPSGTGDCQPDYTLTVSGAGPTGPGPIGTAYCPATANSTGSAASITAEGLTAAAANDLTLIAADMPAFQFGIFLTSQDQAATPVASGTLCLGGNVIRFQGPGQILQADANGEFSLPVDTTAIPAGVPTAIMSGDTWNFQAWFRDVGAMGPTANFTNGVSVDFN